MTTEGGPTGENSRVPRHGHGGARLRRRGRSGARAEPDWPCQCCCRRQHRPVADRGRCERDSKNRTQDLVDLLLKYRPSDTQLSELLRLDVSVPPTPFAAQRRLGPLAVVPDAAAWPNGRRPKDDVTDIAVRVVGGPNYIAARAADGVNTNDKPLLDHFPFLASPFDGRNRHHDNP